MMMNDDHNGDDNDGEDNVFFTRIQRIYCKNPGYEVTPPARCTVPTPRISSDNGFATLHLCLDDDIGGEERSIAGQVRRVEA